jgi:hypothetical protein
MGTMLRTAERQSQAPSPEPPYTRQALLATGNLVAMGGALAATVATGEPWVALCAVAAEAVWLLLAPQSAFLRRSWFDRVLAAEREAALQARLRAAMAGLSPPDAMRACALLEQRERIELLARENPSFASALVKAELAKLTGLVEDFVELGVTAERNERHLGTLDLQGMQRDWQVYAAQVEHFSERDPRHAVAERNLAVLEQRRQRHEDLRRTLGTVRGQMDLIENTFRLLADEIVTMVSPSEIGQRLDELRIAVDAIRETVRDGDMDAVEQDEEARGRETHWQ